MTTSMIILKYRGSVFLKNQWTLSPTYPRSWEHEIQKKKKYGIYETDYLPFHRNKREQLQENGHVEILF